MDLPIVKTEPEDLQTTNQVCRLCLSEESLDDIFNEDELHQWISHYLSIAVRKTDIMSKFICSICRLRLTEFHQFRVNCMEVQVVLLSMVQPELDKAAKQSDATIQCKVCRKIFVSKRKFIEHEKLHGPKIHGCKHCGSSFPLRSSLVRHMKIHGRKKPKHRIELASHESTKFQDVVVKQEPGPLQYEEGDVQRELPKETTPAELQDMVVVEAVKIEPHLDDHLEIPSSARSFSDMSITQNEIDLPLFSVDAAESEQMKNTVEKCRPLRRKRCRNVIELNKKLWARNNSVFVQIGEKQFSCLVCNLVFANRFSINRHMRTKRHLINIKSTIQHNEANVEPEEDFNAMINCNSESVVDNESFTQPMQSNAEVNTFTVSVKDVPMRLRKSSTDHVCHLCGKSFLRRRTLKWHMRKHDPNYVPQPRFPTEPVKCDLCGKMFKHRDSLRHHKRYWHGPKNHKCHLCGYQTSLRSCLERHLERH